MSAIGRAEVAGALRDFRRTWPQLLIGDLLARSLAFVVLTPVVALLLKLFLLQTADRVLTDADIATFVLHPLGIVALIVVLVVFLGMLFVADSLLLIIGFGALQDRLITYAGAIRYALRHGREAAMLAFQVVWRLLLIAAPFLAAIGAVYLLFLGDYDINFYLADRPPEFVRAVALAAALATAMLLTALWFFSGWIIGLPLVLFDGRSGSRALADSNRATRGKRFRISLALIVWIGASLLVSSTASYLIGFVGGALVPEIGGSLYLAVTGLAITLLLAFAVNLSVNVFTAAMFPLLLVRLYHNLAGPGRLSPAVADRGPLGDRASLEIPGARWLWAVGILLVGVGAGIYLIADNLDGEETSIIIAHRGAAGAAPENTMAAFEQAIDDGTDWIELDVQENADGTVIVEHDSDFMRLGGSPLKVWDSTDADRTTLDVGSWFDPDFSGQRVPTLVEALELAKGEVGVVIELKYYGHDDQLEARVVEAVEQTGMEADIKIMSLKLDGIRKFASLRPEWPSGLLNTAAVGNLNRLDVDFLALNAAAATRSQIRQAHAAGKQVFVWTVNDPTQMSVMMSRGADGIITDEPALARQVVEMREQLTPLATLFVWIAGESGLLRGVDESSDPGDA